MSATHSVTGTLIWQQVVGPDNYDRYAAYRRRFGITSALLTTLTFVSIALLLIHFGYLTDKSTQALIVHIGAMFLFIILWAALHDFISNLIGGTAFKKSERDDIVKALGLACTNMATIGSEYTKKEYTLDSPFGEFKTDVNACALDLACRSRLAFFLDQKEKAAELDRLLNGLRRATLRQLAVTPDGKDLFALARQTLRYAGQDT